MNKRGKVLLGCGAAVLLLLIALCAAVEVVRGVRIPMRPPSIPASPAPRRCHIYFQGLNADLEGADAQAAWQLYLAMRASPRLWYVYNYSGPRTASGEPLKASTSYELHFQNADSTYLTPPRFTGVFWGEQAFYIDGIYEGGLEPEVTERFRAFVAEMQAKHRRPD